MPDCEELRYKGTPENPDIKIFVSHRIDQDSETIDNPLYIPVRCGAVYDERENVTMLGDDTGDNISEKRNSYCELTVQYWAWKNVKADYYGFCRNDCCFSLSYPLFSSHSFDIALLKNETIDQKRYANVLEYVLSDFYHFDELVITSVLDAIKYTYPDVLPFANKYLKSTTVQTCGMYIASKEVFNQFCQFQFTILDALGRTIDMTNASSERKQLSVYLSTHLLAIFANYMEQTKNLHVEQLEIVTFNRHNKSVGISPAFAENNIPIVFSSSNSFSSYLGVAIRSLLDHISGSWNYDVIILEKEIDEVHKSRILSMSEAFFNVSIRFVNVSDVTTDVSFYVPTQDLSEETYYTILVPWVLRNYKKALVLDCDIIINEDLAILYNTKLGENYIGAAKEIVYLGFLNNPYLNVNNSLIDYTVIKLGLSNPYDYFNAGVLIMNLEMFRKNYNLCDLLNMISKNKYMIVEQDLLNTICVEKVVFLDYAWNFMSCLTEPAMFNYAISPSDTTIPNLRLAPEQEIAKYKSASNNPYIYHYLTKFKPWKYPDLKYADVWWNTARTTNYYESLLSQLIKFTVDNSSGAFLALPDTRTGARKFADKVLPKGSRRREFAKKLLPKGSRRWNFCKKLYYIIRPEYRPNKAR